VLEMLGDLPDVEARAPENVRGIRGADEGCNVAWRERERVGMGDDGQLLE